MSGERSSCRSSKRTGAPWNRAEPSRRPMNLWSTVGSAVHRVPVALEYQLNESTILMAADTCPRCGWENKDPRGSAVFRCESCGLTMDRQLNAAINLHLRMEGVPRQREWWDGNVLPTLVGGYLLTGAERRGPDELARGLYDAVKPQLYAYDRYADAYLRVPT